MRMTGLATALLVTVATIRGERWPVQEQGKASVSVTNPERAPVTIECSPNVVVETAPKVACRVANVGDDAITALDVITRVTSGTDESIASQIDTLSIGASLDINKASSFEIQIGTALAPADHVRIAVYRVATTTSTWASDTSLAPSRFRRIS
jgi:hypothetical protein